MRNGKKNAIFFTFIICISASYMHSMNQSHTSKFPQEIIDKIIEFFFTETSFTSIAQTSYALRSLACTDSPLNKQIKNPTLLLYFIKRVAKQLRLSDEIVAHNLRIPAAQDRVKLQKELIILCTETCYAPGQGIVNPKFELLLEQGIDLEFLYGISDPTSIRGETALMIAAAHSSNLIYPIVKNGAPINQTNRYGTTALMAASQYKSEFAIRALIKHPLININQQDRYGNSALMHYMKAPGNCAPQLIKLFLNAGADPLLKNAQEQLSIEQARHTHNPDVIKLIQEAIEQKTARIKC